MSFEDVMESCGVRFTIRHHWLVQAFLMESGLVKAILEMVIASTGNRLTKSSTSTPFSLTILQSKLANTP